MWWSLIAAVAAPSRPNRNLPVAYQIALAKIR